MNKKDFLISYIQEEQIKTMTIEKQKDDSKSLMELSNSLYEIVKEHLKEGVPLYCEVPLPKRRELNLSVLSPEKRSFQDIQKDLERTLKEASKEKLVLCDVVLKFIDKGEMLEITKPYKADKFDEESILNFINENK